MWLYIRLSSSHKLSKRQLQVQGWTDEEVSKASEETNKWLSSEIFSNPKGGEQAS